MAVSSRRRTGISQSELGLQLSPRVWGLATPADRALEMVAALQHPLHSKAVVKPGPFADDRRQRIEAVGEGGGARLQDKRRLDFAQPAGAHRGNLGKARPRRDLSRYEFLAAPRADDDVRPRSDH